MRILRHWSWAGFAERPSVATLGNFDGVHRGHQEIIRRAVERARACQGVPVAISFHPHPLSVVTPHKRPLMLGTVRQRIGLFGQHGIEVTILQHFTPSFSHVTAEDFVSEYLVGRLRLRQLVVGHNVGFGHGRHGNADLLARFSRRYGFELEVVPAVAVEGRRVSSSAVRTAVRQGDLRTAAAMLGRAYSVCGRVVHGHHRGKGLGFATANLRVEGLQLPPDGVYAVRASASGGIWMGVANLGFNPTFGDDERALEAHLFDFSGDLYGRRIEVSFVERIRGERRFADAAELADQIRRDADRARQILSGA